MRNVLLAAGLAMALAQFGMFNAANDSRVNAQVVADAHLQADFQARVQIYVELHRRLEGPIPTIVSSNDWAQIEAQVEALATKIRAARKDARQGDIFTRKLVRSDTATLGAICHG